MPLQHQLPLVRPAVYRMSVRYTAGGCIFFFHCVLYNGTMLIIMSPSFPVILPWNGTAAVNVIQVFYFLSDMFVCLFLNLL